MARSPHGGGSRDLQTAEPVFLSAGDVVTVTGGDWHRIVSDIELYLSDRVSRNPVAEPIALKHGDTMTVLARGEQAGIYSNSARLYLEKGPVPLNGKPDRDVVTRPGP